MKFFFIFILFYNSLAFSETIILKDGAKIDGEFEGVMENVYMVRTKYGTLNIKKEDILIPQDIIIKEPEAEKIISAKNISEDIVEHNYSFKIFLESDTIKKIYYEDDIIIATQTFNLKNELISYEGNIKDGKYFEYFENGKIKSEKYFSNGKEEGFAKFYYPSGNLQSQIEYSSGILNGSVFIYSESGKMLFEKNYKNGLLDGWVKEYDENGNVKRQVLYSMGKEYIPANPQKADTIPPQETKKEVPLSLITAKKLKVARGEKLIIYLEKKLKATIIIDKDYNLLFKSGTFPDGTLTIKSEEGYMEKEFTFEKDNIKLLKIFNSDGTIKETYSYNEDKAIKQ